MTVRLPNLLATALLLLALTPATYAQRRAEQKPDSWIGHCRLLCVFVEPPKPEKAPRFTAELQKKPLNAVLVNNTNRNIRVQARGDDWLFYDVMSNADTVKDRYDCHMCYIKTIKPKTVTRFKINGEDITENVFGIRIRYFYPGEKVSAEDIFHYLLWSKK